MSKKLSNWTFRSGTIGGTLKFCSNEEQITRRAGAKLKVKKILSVTWKAQNC